MSVQLKDNDIWSATAVIQEADQVSLLAFFFQIANSLTGGINDLEFISAFNNAFTPVILPVIANAATYVGGFAQRHFPLPITPRAIDKSTSAPGTGGGVLLPRQSAGLTTWYTARAGRDQIGRTYWPFPTNAMQLTTGGFPAGGTVTNYIAIGTALLGISPMIGFAGQCDAFFSLYHRGSGTADRITSQSVAQKWATQKRRGSFGRPNTSPI